MRTRLFLLVLLTVCVSCAAPKYQLPQTQADVQASVSTTENAYISVYSEHKAGQVSPAAMASADVLYESFRRTQAWLMDAVKAGAVTFAKGD